MMDKLYRGYESAERARLIDQLMARVDSQYETLEEIIEREHAEHYLNEIRHLEYLKEKRPSRKPKNTTNHNKKTLGDMNYE